MMCAWVNDNMCHASSKSPAGLGSYYNAQLLMPLTCPSIEWLRQLHDCTAAQHQALPVVMQALLSSSIMFSNFMSIYQRRAETKEKAEQSNRCPFYAHCIMKCICKLLDNKGGRSNGADPQK